MSAHPDKGGKAAEFEKINRSKLVLLDPKRRDKYDRTGEIDEDAPDNAISAPLGIILAFFQKVCAGNAQGQIVDPCSIDLIDTARKQFHDTISKIEGEKRQISKMAKSMERIAARIKVKKGKDDLLVRSVKIQAGQLAAQLSLADQKIKAHKDAIAMLGDYSFNPEASQQGMGSFFNITIR